VGTKRELSNTAKLSVFKWIFVLILTYGYESWVMTERIFTQVQTPKLRFSRRVHDVTKGRAPGARNKFVVSIFEPSCFGIK